LSSDQWRTKVSPFYLLVVHLPAFDPQQFSDLAVAVAAIALCEADHGQPQRVIVLLDGVVLHRAAGKADHPARPPLRRCELLAFVYDGLTKLARRPPLGDCRQSPAGQWDPGL